MEKKLSKLFYTIFVFILINTQIAFSNNSDIPEDAEEISLVAKYIDKPEVNVSPVNSQRMSNSRSSTKLGELRC